MKLPKKGGHSQFRTKEDIDFSYHTANCQYHESPLHKSREYICSLHFEEVNSICELGNGNIVG